MQVILLDKIHNLGQLGQQVQVKPGYGRNYLIPQGKAVPATTENIKKFEARRAEIEKAAKDLLALAEKRASALANASVTISVKAGEEGHLYGSINTAAIAHAVSEQTKTSVVKSEVMLPNGSLRQLGDYDIVLRLHSEVSCTIKLTISPEA